MNGNYWKPLILVGGVAVSGAHGVVAADAIVAADGSGQYKTVQAAIFAAPQNRNFTNRWVIFVKPGKYTEHVVVPREKRGIQLVGANAVTTVISSGRYASMHGPDGKPLGTLRTATVQIDADDCTVEQITVENTAGPKGQAVALRIDGDRVVFRHCRFLGWQDTLLGNQGRHYFAQCYIAGACDFIFGGATGFFEQCEIHCAGAGYITAAATAEHQPYGFVFANCKVTAESPAVKTYLGRPWRPFASVTFLNTELPSQIRPAGWHNWNAPSRELTARYAEFHSTGPGANPAARVKWSRQLSAAEAAGITGGTVLHGSDGWHPQTELSRELPAPKAVVP